jgi:hypothetical protein
MQKTTWTWPKKHCKLMINPDTSLVLKNAGFLNNLPLDADLRAEVITWITDNTLPRAENCEGVVKCVIYLGKHVKSDVVNGLLTKYRTILIEFESESICRLIYSAHNELTSTILMSSQNPRLERYNGGQTQMMLHLVMEGLKLCGHKARFDPEENEGIRVDDTITLYYINQKLYKKETEDEGISDLDL